MDYDGVGIQIRGGGRLAVAVKDVASAAAAAVPDIDEETLWQMSLKQSESAEAGPFPERPGEPDCAYFIRTGLCRFGFACRFNHPSTRTPAIGAARNKGGYPERIGQPECQYYLKTGTCKFGATCKFHHPKDQAGIAVDVQLNISGYPLRPDEKECVYYLRTGQCKFGNSCKFHHPQPPSTMVSPRGSPAYSSACSPTSPGQQFHPGTLANWPLSGTFIPSNRWQGASSYASVILPHGLVQVSGWNAYPGQLGSVSSVDGQKQSPGTPIHYYGTLRRSEANAESQGGLPSFRSGSLPVWLYALPAENIFPERPDQPECQFYMKTGDCKFGAACRFHHPRERVTPVPNCILSPMGLPLRPGEQVCIFYSRNGICKFGPNCKFDHPMGALIYPLPTSVGNDTVDAGTGKPLSRPLLSLSEPRKLSSAEENSLAEGSRITTVKASSFS